MAIRNVLLTIAYDGSGYAGWQKQPDKRTIQGELAEAVSALFRTKVNVHAASRTDAGVSALGQKALIQIDSPIPTENIARAISNKLPPEIIVSKAEDIFMGFDIIGAVKAKLYRYTIFTGPVRPVLDINHCWHIPAGLDAEAMDKAAKLLVGTKDFKSFASAKDTREHTVRTVFRCDVMQDGEWINIEIEGDGFLYNMVRNIAGTLVEVGAGRLEPERITEILDAKNRTAAGPIATAKGLCLMWIKY
jgi:tRNA pseudouridine38-40 synthase